jgi:hypothetical protein
VRGARLGGGGGAALVDGDVPALDSATSYTKHGARRAMEAAAAWVLVEGFKLTTNSDEWRTHVDAVLALSDADSVASFVDALLRTPAAATTRPELVMPTRFTANAPAVTGTFVADVAFQQSPSIDASTDALLAAVDLLPLTAYADTPLLSLCEDMAWQARLVRLEATEGAARAETAQFEAVSNLKDLAAALANADAGRNASLAAAYILTKLMTAASSTAKESDRLIAACALIIAAQAIAVCPSESSAATALNVAFSDGVVQSIRKALTALPSHTAASDDSTGTSALHAARGTFSIVADEPPAKKTVEPAATTTTTTTAAATAATTAATDGATTDAAAPAAADAPVDQETQRAITEAQRAADADGDSDADDHGHGAAARRRQKKKKEAEAKTPPQWRVPIILSPFATSVEVTVEATSEGRIRVLAAGVDIGAQQHVLRQGESCRIALPGNAEGKVQVVLVSGIAPKATIHYNAALAVPITTAAADALRGAWDTFIASIFALRLHASATAVPTVQSMNRSTRNTAALASSSTTTTTMAANTPLAAPVDAASAEVPTTATPATTAVDAVEPQDSIRIAPLLRGGLSTKNASEDTAAESMKVLDGDDNVAAKLKLVYGRAFIQNDSQRACARATLAVMLRYSTSWDAAANELVQQWHASLGTMLQGSINEPMRARLVELARWLVSNVSTTDDAAKVGPAAALDHFKVLLSSNVPITAIEAELNKRQEAAKALPAVAKTVAEALASTSANSSANTSSKLRVACAMARLAASGGIDSLGDGASLETARNVAASLDAVLQSLAVAATTELKRQAVPTNTRVSAAAIVGYLGLTTLLKSANARTLASFQLSFHQIVEAAANEADRICKAADGADEADPSRDAAALHRVVSDLALTTNRSGTTIHRGPTGITIESTGMGVHSVRSATTWPLKWKRGDALLRYFEASVDAKRVTVKRIILGLADPLADVTTISAVMRPNSKYRVVAIDSSSLNDQAYVAPFSAIDVIGCGIDVTTSEVFFTLNGAVVRRRPLVQDESANALADGNLVVGSAVLQSIKARDLTELVPFLLYETTDRASVQLNLGQAPFAQDFRALSKLSSTSSVGASYAGDLALQALPNLAVAVEASVGEASTLAKGLGDALRNGLRALTAAGAKADGDDAGLVRLASVLSALAHVAFHKRLLKPAELFADLIKATTASTGMTKVVLLATVADIADRDSALANNHATELVELAAPVALAPKRATKPATSTFEPLWEQT